MRNHTDSGFTLIELLIVVAIIGIIAAIAVPGLMRARISGNEAWAIGSLRAITSAEGTFSASCAGGKYAGGLDVLGTAPPSGTSAFLSPDLAQAPSVTKSGYVVSLAGTAVSGVTACNGSSNVTAGFHAWADPMSSSTGTRYFFTNTTGTVWQMTSSGAAGSDTGAPSGGTPIQ